MHFQDKVIWITGASSGIGRELVKQLAAKGSTIILSSRREDKLVEVASEAELPNRRHMILPLDVEDYHNFEKATKRVYERFGKVDILINNAGVTQRSTAIETSLEVDERIFRINYFGAIALTKQLLPHMIDRKDGHIVTISSVTGKFGTPLRSAYAASKHALHGFFDSLRAEVHDNNVKVTLVCPGFIQTPISKSALKGDGTVYGIQDSATANGISVENCVGRILAAIKNEKSEVYIANRELAAIYLKRFFPSLLARIIRKVKVT